MISKTLRPASRSSSIALRSSRQPWLPVLLCLLGVLSFNACDDDDDSDPATLTATDFSASLTEGAAVGTLIGQLGATGAVGTPLTYRLTSSDPSGALAVSSAGEVTVADAAAFNVDERQAVTGAFTVEGAGLSASGSMTITVLDDGVVAPEDQRLREGFVVSATTPGGSLLVEYLAAWPTSSVDLSSGTDFQQFFPVDGFEGALFNANPDGSGGFSRIMANGLESIIIDAMAPVVGENSFQIAVRDANTGVFHDRNSPGLITVFNPTTMAVEATIDMSAGLVPGSGTPPRYQTFYFRGDEVFAPLRPEDGSFYDSLVVQVANLSNGTYARSIVVREEAAAPFNDFGQRETAEDGTLYISDQGNLQQAPALASQVSRILPGANDADATYAFRPASVLDPSNILLPIHRGFRYIGNGKAIALVASGTPQSVIDIVTAAGGVQNLTPDQIQQVLGLLFTEPTANWCLLDVNAQTVEIIPSIPRVSVYATAIATVDGDDLLLPVTTATLNEAWRYNPASNSASLAFTVSGGGTLTGMYNLGVNN